MRTIIVLPTYNEIENISNILTAIFDVVKSKSLDVSLIVVDDNSPDGTADVVSEMSKNHPIALIKREGKLGLGTAYIEGFKRALDIGCDAVMEMDADFSHDPNDIPRFIQALSEFDAAIGSRKVKGGKIIGWGPYRRLTSWFGSFLGRSILKIDIRDITTGYRIYKREVIEKVDIDGIESNGYAFQLEMLYRVIKSGFNVAEIPIVFLNREKGKSKLSWKDSSEFFKMAFKLRSSS